MTQFCTLALTPKLYLIVLRIGKMIYSEIVDAANVAHTLQQFYFASAFSEPY